VVIFFSVVEKVLLTLVPKVVIATMETTIIRATITAYSTAVGPFSSCKNAQRFFLIRFNLCSFVGCLNKLKLNQLILPISQPYLENIEHLTYKN